MMLYCRLFHRSLVHGKTDHKRREGCESSSLPWRTKLDSGAVLRGEQGPPLTRREPWTCVRSENFLLPFLYDESRQVDPMRLRGVKGVLYYLLL